MKCPVDECTGCGACVNICPNNCILLRYNADGFLYPEVNENKCVKCGKCDDVCPIINGGVRTNWHDPIFFAGWARNYEIRTSSTSGGIFPVLADHILSQEGVVFGVVWGEQFQPIHSFGVSKEDIVPMKGSKYLQSDTALVFRKIRELLVAQRLVLFSGTPCQVSGLYKFLEETKTAINKLLTCEVICHGVISKKVFESYIKDLEGKKGVKVRDVIFRSKKKGWSFGHSEIIYRDLRADVVRAKNNFLLKSYYSRYSVRESCIQCQYSKLPRVADFSIGDYWGALLERSSQADLKAGISLILVNNERSRKILFDLRDKVHFEEISAVRALKRNRNVTDLPPYPTKRNEFWKDFHDSKNINMLYKKYFPGSLKISLSNLLGETLTKNIRKIVLFLKGCKE